MTEVFLQARGLTCERDWRVLFSGLELQLEYGQMLQVSGPNGSGKTSLLRLLAGLMQPTAGEILYLGIPLGRQRHELARHSLWIGHAAGIKGLLTPEENLAWLTALQNSASDEAIAEALQAVGLKGFEDVPCHTLSAGQQRRVGLARLYLPEAPALWILDEPFTALDKKAVAQLEQHLAGHCERGGMVIFTTHHELQHRPASFCELELGQ
ncbi:MAG: cytochrome c biogenesis heme-transporting ATPase CcmA [Gammaproteobacteria bacterium]|nr:cytochrome c biogenesis heme-transporting ATPase CcmA [Gammaproteobacteria bacterium]